jgi:tetratricopeptide (TPR) repeat protein
MLAAASRGRWREVDAGVELFLDYFPWAARVRGAVRAAAASELGNVDQARALLDRLGARGFADIERDEHWFLILVCLSIAATNVSHQERARELFVLLEPYRDRFAYHDMLRMHMGSVSLHTGALCRVLGQLDEAERHLEAALAAHELHEAAPLQVVTQLERARLAIARGDRAAAKQRAEACAALAERLGSTHYRQRAVAILEKLA